MVAAQRAKAAWQLLSACLVCAFCASRAQNSPSSDPWATLQSKKLVSRPSALYKFTDYDIPRDENIRTKCLGARFCECSVESGYNRTFWLNTASAVYNGEVYLVILQRTIVLQSVVHYRQMNKTMRGQVLEFNSLLLCKAGLTDKFKINGRDCKLVEPGPGYREKHPYPPRGYWFELNGLIDPRLVSAGNGAGLFLQAGCRPYHLATNPNITKFREGLCLVKLLGDQPPRRQQQQQRQLRADNTLTASMAPLLPGMTIRSADWPTGKLMSITHASGIGQWEKSWVPFNYKGTILFSRTLSPHQVVTVHANGIASTLYKVDNSAVFSHLSGICGKGPRGNSAAALIQPSESGLPRPVYLNVLHWTPHRDDPRKPEDRACLEYLNFFYLMDSEPPFNILEVSRSPIPLLAATNPVLDQPPLEFGMGYISFPTGLLVLGGQVIITYGSGDAQLRVFKADLTDVLKQFTHSWITTPPNATLVQGTLP